MVAATRGRKAWWRVVALAGVAGVVVPLVVLGGGETFTATPYANVIRFEAPGVASLQVEIFDLSGRRLWDSGVVSGRTVDWNRTNMWGERLAYGAYLYGAQGWNAQGKLVFQKSGKLALLPGDKVQLQAVPTPTAPQPSGGAPQVGGALQPLGGPDFGSETLSCGHIFVTPTTNLYGLWIVREGYNPQLVFGDSFSTYLAVQWHSALDYGRLQTYRNGAAGGSLAFQPLAGNVGIGTRDPTSRLTVKGVIETTEGGVKFPDGTIQTTAAGGGATSWNLTGNAGTNPATHFLGTSDRQPLVIRVNNQPVYRFYPVEDLGLPYQATNIIGGYWGNRMTGEATVGVTICGGGHRAISDEEPNEVTGNFGTVCGGSGNVAAEYAFVGGGRFNRALQHHATVSGGESNIASGQGATVGGGGMNQASNDGATVCGGGVNVASGVGSVVIGGEGNEAAGEFSIAGGWKCVAGGPYSVALGWECVTDGAYSVVLGRAARAWWEPDLYDGPTHDGCFVFLDSTTYPYWGTERDNQVLMRATGGYWLYTSANPFHPNASGVVLLPGSSSWSSLCDRSVKANFAPVDTGRLLKALGEMPILTWNLNAQSAEIRHIGPVAQDFNAAFGDIFGPVESPTHINMMDAIGVSLAASQGLYQVVQEQAQEIERLQARLDALQKLVEELLERGH